MWSLKFHAQAQLSVSKARSTEKIVHVAILRFRQKKVDPDDTRLTEKIPRSTELYKKRLNWLFSNSTWLELTRIYCESWWLDWLRPKFDQRMTTRWWVNRISRSTKPFRGTYVQIEGALKEVSGASYWTKGRVDRDGSSQELAIGGKGAGQSSG